MKNLLNCHSVGLHSFPISLENGLYRRVFYATPEHNLHKPVEIAIHPHHVDIKITVLDGVLFNPLYEVSKGFNGHIYGKYKWNSHILNGNGGFEHLGHEHLSLVSKNGYNKGEYFTMKACELHTVFVEQGKSAVWLIEESIPTCDYFPINYSPHDLTKWTPDGLYLEVSDDVKMYYLEPYMDEINVITKINEQ